MPKLKYLWLYNHPLSGIPDLSSQQRSTWAKKCPNIVLNGDENCTNHHIASPYEFGGGISGQIWEIPCEGLAFADPYEADWDGSESDSSGPYWPYSFPPPMY